MGAMIDQCCAGTAADVVGDPEGLTITIGGTTYRGTVDLFGSSWRGRLDGVGKDLVIYEADSRMGLYDAFVEAVDDYRATRAALAAEGALISDIEAAAAARDSNRAGDSMEISPEQALLTAIHDIRTGARKVSRLLILGVEDGGDGRWSRVVWRSNLPMDNEALLLQVSQHAVMKQWLG